MVSSEAIVMYSLPFNAPFFCNDWTTFLFHVLKPDRFLGTFVDLLTLLLDQLDMHARVYSVPAHLESSGPGQDLIFARQCEVYRSMHAAMSSASPFQDSPVGSWEEFVCLLAQSMDMASHVRQFLCTGQDNQRQIGLFVDMLVAVCAANRRISWLLCMHEGRGGVREPSFRIPDANSDKYIPTALHPFGYDFIPFSALHGSGLPERAPDGPEHPSVGGSLFKHGPDGSWADDDSSTRFPLFPFVSPAPAPSPPPVWDHSVFLPAPPYPPPGHIAAAGEGGCPGPAGWFGGCEPGGAAPEAALGGGAQPGGGQGQGWGGAGADARHAAHFIQGAQVRQHGGEGGGPLLGPRALGGVGPREPEALPSGGQCGECPLRWSAVVRQQPPRAPDPVVDPWPTLAAASVGQRRRRDEGLDAASGGRRARC